MVMPNVSNYRLPQSAEEIFADFRSRRKGLIRALTSDADHFFSRCDPEAENLCLYGNSDETWEVALPPEEVPPELPDPTIGINFARDGMKRHEWFSLVAVHCDSWLLSVSFFLASKMRRSERGHLFNLINELPTVYEVVFDYMRNKSTADTMNKSKSVKRESSGHVRGNSVPLDEMYYEQDNEQGETLCGSCGRNSNGGDEFWIGCDICDRWFHGKCVKITPAKAETIKVYRCPYCSSKKSRP